MRRMVGWGRDQSEHKTWDVGRIPNEIGRENKHNLLQFDYQSGQLVSEKGGLITA